MSVILKKKDSRAGSTYRVFLAMDTGEDVTSVYRRGVLLSDVKKKKMYSSLNQGMGEGY